MEAQPTACTWSGMILRIRLTWLTSTVMPRSLKEPVWLFPHCLTQRSFIPSVSLQVQVLISTSIPSCDRVPCVGGCRHLRVGRHLSVSTVSMQ